MANYYKNWDQFECTADDPVLYGIQYRTISDLVSEPVSLDFFKDAARIDFDTDDTLCEIYIQAARIELEQWSQLSFGVKTIGLTALYLPKNWRLVHGPVDEVTTTGFTNVGDILKEGGKDIDIEFTTLNTYFNNNMVKVAIARYAAGLYVSRENVVDTQFASQVRQDEAKLMLDPIRIKTWF